MCVSEDQLLELDDCEAHRRSRLNPVCNQSFSLSVEETDRRESHDRCRDMISEALKQSSTELSLDSTSTREQGPQVDGPILGKERACNLAVVLTMNSSWKEIESLSRCESRTNQREVMKTKSKRSIQPFIKRRCTGQCTMSVSTRHEVEQHQLSTNSCRRRRRFDAVLDLKLKLHRRIIVAVRPGPNRAEVLRD